MSSKTELIIKVSMVLFSWLSLFFFCWRNIKKYLPAAFLVVIFEALNVQLGKKQRWWVFYKKPNSYLSNEFPFNIGPFFVGAMWILKLTYGNFKKFLLVNASINAFFAFVLTGFLKKLNVAQLVKLNKFEFFLYFFYKAFFLYGFQYLIENKKNFT
jgi:hypothetical protein